MDRPLAAGRPADINNLKMPSGSWLTKALFDCTRREPFDILNWRAFADHLIDSGEDPIRGEAIHLTCDLNSVRGSLTPADGECKYKRYNEIFRANAPTWFDLPFMGARSTQEVSVSNYRTLPFELQVTTISDGGDGIADLNRAHEADPGTLSRLLRAGVAKLVLERYCSVRQTPLSRSIARQFAANIYHLKLRECTPTCIASYARDCAWTPLQTLEVRAYSKDTDIDRLLSTVTTLVKKSSTLRSFDYSGEAISESLKSALSDSPELAELAISEPGWTRSLRSEGSTWSRFAPSLRSVSLTSPINTRTAQSLAELKMLEKLNFDGSRGVDTQHLRRLATNAPRLSKLWVSSALSGAWLTAALKPFEVLSELTFSVHHGSINDRELKEIVKGRSTLRTLSLYGDFSSVSTISSLAELAGLRDLAISNDSVPIDRQGLKALATGAKELRCLELQLHRNFTDFEAFAEFHSLEQLDFGKYSKGPNLKQLRAIIRSNPNLKFIGGSLNTNRLGSVRVLADFPHVEFKIARLLRLRAS